MIIIDELELLAVLWGLEHFRLYIYGKPKKFHKFMTKNTTNSWPNVVALATIWTNHKARYQVTNRNKPKHVNLFACLYQPTKSCVKSILTNDS